MLAPGAGLSAWVRLLCLKCCEAEAAPSLPLMVPALLPPAWTHWLASTEQGGPAIMSQQGQGWGQATKGTMLPAGCLPLPQLCSMCCGWVGRSQGAGTAAGPGHLCNNTFAECAQGSMWGYGWNPRAVTRGEHLWSPPRPSFRFGFTADHI